MGDEMDGRAAMDGQDAITEETSGDVVVYTQGWKGDSPAPPEENTAMLGHLIVIDGKPLLAASGFEVLSVGYDFWTIKLHLAPRSVRFEVVDQETWERLWRGARGE